MMKRILPILILVLAGGGFFAYQNCGKSQVILPVDPTKPATEEAASAAETLEDRYEELEALANQDLACNQDADCVAVGIGARACGGPEKYIVTSKSNDLALLEELNNALVELEKRRFAEEQIMGICMVAPEPSVQCVESACQAGQ